MSHYDDRAELPAGCPDLSLEDLVAHLDGELDGAASARVAAHVQSCPRCAEEAADLRESGEALALLPGLEPAAGFADGVLLAARGADGSPTREQVPDRAVGPAPRAIQGPYGVESPVVPLSWPRLLAAAALLLGAGLLWEAARRSTPVGPPDPGRTTDSLLAAREEEAIARDLLLLANLDLLRDADADEISRLVEDLDVLDALGPEDPTGLADAGEGG